MGSNLSNSTGLSGSGNVGTSAGIPKAKKKNNISQLSSDASKYSKSLMANAALLSNRGSTSQLKKHHLAGEQSHRDSPQEHSAVKQFDFV